MNFQTGGSEMAVKKETSTSVRETKIANEKVVFEFSSPKAREVCLTGDFNGWDSSTHPMKKARNGLWKATLPLAPGRYEYRFLADGQWENDPSCSSCVTNPFGSKNCVKTVE
jgi:1,4-alpha-glucan branching enzyme